MEEKSQKMLHVKAEITKSSTEEGVIDATIASTALLDRQGDVIDQDGWDIKNFMKNPVVLWGHNVREERPPIGKALKVWFEGEGKKKKLMFKTQFDMADEFAAEIYRKVKEGFINMVSVGFLPKEWEKLDRNDPFSGNRFVSQELLEVSYVPVPANPQAAVSLRSIGVEPIEEDKLYPQHVDKLLDNKEIEIGKGVIPFKATETVHDSTEWDGPAEIAKATTEDLKTMSAWYDAENPDVKSSYKLVHHKADGHAVVWRGVASSMALLLGAKGGVNIPEDDRKAVYNHLAKHYEQFDKEVPEYRMVEDQILKGLSEEIGALMIEKNEKYTVRLIKKAIELIKESNNEKKVKIEQTLKTNEEYLKLALTVVDKAVEKAFAKSLKGGE